MINLIKYSFIHFFIFFIAIIFNNSIAYIDLAFCVLEYEDGQDPEGFNRFMEDPEYILSDLSDGYISDLEADSDSSDLEQASTSRVDSFDFDSFIEKVEYSTFIPLSLISDYSIHYIDNIIDRVDDVHFDNFYANLDSISANISFFNNKNLKSISNYLNSHFKNIFTYVDKFSPQPKTPVINLDLDITNIQEAFDGLLDYLYLAAPQMERLRSDLNKLDVPIFPTSVNTNTVSYFNRYNFIPFSTNVYYSMPWFNRFQPTNYIPFLHVDNADFSLVTQLYILLFEFFSPHMASRFLYGTPTATGAANFTVPPEAATRQIAVTPTATEIYNMYYGWEKPPTPQRYVFSNLPGDYGWNPNNPLCPVRSLCENQYTGPLARSYVLTTKSKKTSDFDLIDLLISMDNSGINPEHFQHWIRDVDPSLIEMTNECLHQHSNWIDKYIFFVFSYYNGPGRYCAHNIPNNIEPYCTIQQLFGTVPYTTQGNKNALETIYSFITLSNGSYLISFNDTFKLAFENAYGSIFEIPNVKNLFVIEHPHDFEQTLIGRIDPGYTRVHPISIFSKGNETIAEKIEEDFFEKKSELIEEDSEFYGERRYRYYSPRVVDFGKFEKLITKFEYEPYPDCTEIDEDVKSYVGYNRFTKTYLDMEKFEKETKIRKYGLITREINNSYLIKYYNNFKCIEVTTEPGDTEINFFFYNYLINHTTVLDSIFEKYKKLFEVELSHSGRLLSNLNQNLTTALPPDLKLLELEFNNYMDSLYEEQDRIDALLKAKRGYQLASEIDEFSEEKFSSSEITQPFVYKSTHSEASSSTQPFVYKSTHSEASSSRG